MHLVFGHALGLDGQEGASADMKRHGFACDASRRQLVEKRGREVKACGWRGDGSLTRGINGLISRLIFRRVTFRAA